MFQGQSLVAWSRQPQRRQKCDLIAPGKRRHRVWWAPAAPAAGPIHAFIHAWTFVEKKTRDCTELCVLKTTWDTTCEAPPTLSIHVVNDLRPAHHIVPCQCLLLALSAKSQNSPTMRFPLKCQGWICSSTFHVCKLKGCIFFCPFIQNKQTSKKTNKKTPLILQRKWFLGSIMAHLYYSHGKKRLI